MNNAFFQTSDPHIAELDGFTFPDGWWSRGYEYPWALTFAEPGQTVADMGTCYQYRPLRYELAQVCAHTYAVDWNPELLKQKPADHLEYVVANICGPIEAIPAGSLDRVFCISVLEELNDIKVLALGEFKRLLKPDGLIVITCDSRYSVFRPFPVKYPGIDMDDFIRTVDLVGLEFDGPVDLDKSDAFFHDEWNLAVFHCILRHAHE